VQGDGHAVSDLEFALVFGLVSDWHGEECTRVDSSFASVT
jgi:hypothetical protein